MKKIFVFALFCFSFLQAQEVKIPDNFIEMPIPNRQSYDWYKQNYSSESYPIKKGKGEVIIEEKEKGERSELKVKGGKLIGIDEGEWGGGLFFRTPNLQEKLLVIKPGNTKDLFKFKNKIYFIQGLAHLTISEGSLYELSRIKNKFTYKKITDFDDAPFAITEFNNKFFVVSYKNFYIVDLNTNKTIKIFDNQFWANLYPNSIVVFDEKNIFVGMRAGIMKINSIDKIIKFYKANR